VDGIPFFLTRGDLVAGLPERPCRYVDYCSEQCDWSPVRFGPKSPEEKQTALAKLLASPKWGRQLGSSEIEPFARQVRERVKP
jgi:hypothetical protein